MIDEDLLIYERNDVKSRSTKYVKISRKSSSCGMAVGGRLQNVPANHEDMHSTEPQSCHLRDSGRQRGFPGSLFFGPSPPFAPLQPTRRKVRCVKGERSKRETPATGGNRVALTVGGSAV